VFSHEERWSQRAFWLSLMSLSTWMVWAVLDRLVGAAVLPPLWMIVAPWAFGILCGLAAPICLALGFRVGERSAAWTALLPTVIATLFALFTTLVPFMSGGNLS